MVSNIFYFHPDLGKWSNLTNIFQMGWNHQLDINVVIMILSLVHLNEMVFNMFFFAIAQQVFWRITWIKIPKGALTQTCFFALQQKVLLILPELGESAPSNQFCRGRQRLEMLGFFGGWTPREAPWSSPFTLVITPDITHDGTFPTGRGTVYFTVTYVTAKIYGTCYGK